MTHYWHILGIQPTKDEQEIRRAYARELKKRRPDQDPQGFQALREAFDAAKSFASQPEHHQQSEPIALEEPVQPLMEEPLTPLQEHWHRDHLRNRAQSLSLSLIRDELTGRGELHHYLDNEMPDSIEARQVFSQQLAEALIEKPGLTRSLLNEVSAIMNWQLNSYNSSPLSPRILDAFEQQIINTQRENYWQQLAVKYSGSRLKNLQWRLLAEKGTPIPWWGRLVPGLFKEIIEIRKNYPQLQERLNPLLLREYYQPSKILSWDLTLTLLFWLYTSWQTSTLAIQGGLQSGLMLIIVGSFWCYSMTDPPFKTQGLLAKGLQALFWLISVILIMMPIYWVWHAIGTLPEGNAKAEVAITGLALLVIATGAAVWQNRYDWRTVPITIVVAVVKFPLVLLRVLPPVINIFTLLLLSIFYSVIIEMVFLMD